MRWVSDFCILHRTKNETAEKCRSSSRMIAQSSLTVRTKNGIFCRRSDRRHRVAQVQPVPQSGRKPKGQHGHPNAPFPNIDPLKIEH